MAQALVGGLVGAGDVHVAERQPRPDEVGGGEVGVDLERLAHLALGGLEVHGVLELDAGHGHVGARVPGGELEGLLDHLAGVARVVLVEEELGAIEERLHALLAARLLGGVVGVVGVARAAEQVRGAAHQGEADGIVGR